MTTNNNKTCASQKLLDTQDLGACAPTLDSTQEASDSHSTCGAVTNLAGNQRSTDTQDSNVSGSAVVGADETMNSTTPRPHSSRLAYPIADIKAGKFDDAVWERETLHEVVEVEDVVPADFDEGGESVED